MPKAYFCACRDAPHNTIPSHTAKTVLEQRRFCEVALPIFLHYGHAHPLFTALILLLVLPFHGICRTGKTILKCVYETLGRNPKNPPGIRNDNKCEKSLHLKYVRVLPT